MGSVRRYEMLFITRLNHFIKFFAQVSIFRVEVSILNFLIAIALLILEKIEIGSSRFDTRLNFPLPFFLDSLAASFCILIICRFGGYWCVVSLKDCIGLFSIVVIISVVPQRVKSLSVHYFLQV